jgi:hypothetical protein
MLFLPTSRHRLLPAFALLIFVLFYRSVVRVPTSMKTIVRYRPRPQIQYGVKIPEEIVHEHFLPFQDRSEGHLWPEQKHYYAYLSPTPGHPNPYLEPLLQCRRRPNPHTNHVRLPSIIRNVSQLTSPHDENAEQKFNPTIIALPPWSPHQYLLVSRVVTEGLHQESLLCEADTCHSSSSTSGQAGPDGRRPSEKNCTADDLEILGSAGGLRCAIPPITISIPPTPAERCEGSWSSFPDIPGFHDPRIFWSGKGEPLIMVNSASRYACVGLWIIDLRTLHEPLGDLVASQPGRPYHPGPLMSYPSLTELTRNPASTRASVEKNWFLFFPSPAEAFLHYDLSTPRLEREGGVNGTTGGRTFAKVFGNGFTTPNLTDPGEAPCLPAEQDARGKVGRWHQATNALKLVLCRRGEAERRACSEEQEGRAVHFAVMHRKFSNQWDLPLRYERFFVVWDAAPPFRMLGISQHPILLWNETASGWSAEENWADATSSSERDDFTTGFHHHHDGEEASTNKTAEISFSAENEFLAMNPTRSTRNITTSSKPEFPNNADSHSPSPPPSPPILSPDNKHNWAYFTYTPSIAWAWRASPAIPPLRQHENHERAGFEDEDDHDDDDDDEEHGRMLEALNVGYLDDEVIVGVGVDDQGQGFARARAEELLGCLRRCGGD